MFEERQEPQIQEEVDYNVMVNEIITLCQGDTKEEDLIRSRRKLRKREILLLEKEYKRNPNWSKENIQEIAS